MSRSCLGQFFFSENRLFFKEATCPGQLRCPGQNFFSKNGNSGIMRLLCAEQDVGNIKKSTSGNSRTPVRRTKRQKSQKSTFRNSGTPVRRTKRRKSQTNALPGILGVLCAEQDIGNLKKCTSRISGTPVRRTQRQKFQKMHFQGLGNSCAQNQTSDISKTALSGILGLLCARQNVGNLQMLAFKNPGTPVRRTRRQNCFRTTRRALRITSG